MIHECMIDPAMNRIMRHFGSRLVLRPPATMAELAELETRVGPLPRGLVLFLATCNGLRVKLQDPASEHLFSVREMLAALGNPQQPPVPAGFIPLRGEVSAACDWLCIAAGPVQETVIRWDPSTGSHELLASTFSRYFEAWSAFLVDQFDSRAKPMFDNLFPFDERFTLKTDPSLHAFRDKPEVQAWFRELDLASCCGSDCE